MPNSLETQNPLSSDRQVVKINDDSTGLLLKDNRVFVEEQPTEDNEVSTKKYVDDSVDGLDYVSTRLWSNTSGGYKTNNNSASNYYFQYYANENVWSNYESSPTTILYSDAYSYSFGPATSGALTSITVSGRALDTGWDDPFRFYVFKGTIEDSDPSFSLTQIGVTGIITPPSTTRVFHLETNITSSNTFSASDFLWVMYKKESTSANQDLYFSVTIKGTYDN